MTLEPVNRHILVQTIEEEKQEQASGVLLPDGCYSKQVFGLCRVLAKSSDCAIGAEVGQVIVVDNSMIEGVVVGDTHFSLILENHVLGVVSENVSP